MNYRTLLLFLLLWLSSCQPLPEKQSGAGEAMEFWAMPRSYPDGRIYSNRWAAEFFRLKSSARIRGGGPGEEWTALGPKNIGGRTLCLAFHPDNPDIIFAGSASGGLWKTETAGKGASAWTYIPTGFPVLGVAAIAIDPTDPDIIYIGTGEVYNYSAANPGVVDRFTRGTYGIGILKTTDGGQTWFKSLDWSLEELTGVQDILINPQNPQTVYAATTEGLFRSYDAGLTWTNIHPKSMAVDLHMHQLDTAVLWVTHGNYGSPDRGIFRTTDGGQSFELLSNGIPVNYTGKTLLATCPSKPDQLYASVSDSGTGVGLYVSDDKGDSWHLVNPTDVPKYQGWYSHDLAVKPTNANFLVYGGIDIFVTANGGVNLTQTAYWYYWYLGLTQPGEPEGPYNYVHADIHAIYFHPQKANAVFLATDGGIFVSEDSGYSWEARNGGYQTQQFFANFSNSATDSLFAMGGLQDNATAVFIGQDAWWRILGGDGMSTAIHPENDSIFFVSFQNLSMRRTIDRGESFQSTLPQEASWETRAFDGPFEMAPSNPNILYAGAQRLYRTDNLGTSWLATSPNPVDGENPILTIAVGPDDPDLVFVSTASPTGGPAGVFKSTNGGHTWQPLNGLPDRVAMDIAIHPGDPQTVYVVFSGFGTPHLYRSSDGGDTWQAIGGDLPDVPTNTLVIDPLHPSNLYLGNDLGVFASTNGGGNWAYLPEGLPDAVLAMHLSISPVNRKLRLATHGNGVYETDLLEPPSGVQPEGDGLKIIRIFPNPASDAVWIEMEKAAFSVELLDVQGRVLWKESTAAAALTVDLRGLPAGLYYCRVVRGLERKVVPVVVLR